MQHFSSICYFVRKSRFFVVAKVSTTFYGKMDRAAFEVKNFVMSDPVYIDEDDEHTDDFTSKTWFSDCSNSGVDDIVWCFDEKDRHQCWLSCKSEFVLMTNLLMTYHVFKKGLPAVQSFEAYFYLELHS